MVDFDYELTDPPKIDSSEATDTALNWGGYALVIGAVIAIAGVARQSIAPLFEQALEALPGINTGGGGGLQL